MSRAASFARESDPTHICECVSSLCISLCKHRATAGPHQRSSGKAPRESRLHRSASSSIIRVSIGRHRQQPRRGVGFGASASFIRSALIVRSVNPICGGGMNEVQLPRGRPQRPRKGRIESNLSTESKGRPVGRGGGCLTATCDKWRMASLSALLILATRAFSMEPRPTRIQHVHPAATIQPRSKLAQVLSLEVQRAVGARPRSVRTRVPMTQSGAHQGPRMRLS
jgi:hypothetical protein